MGADIHMYAEYRNPGYDGWVAVGGRTNPGRDYDLFGKIAGVRCDGQLFPTRGLPEKLGYQSRSDSQLYVTDATLSPDEGAVTRERAESWVAGGSSTWTDERKAFVSHPDWHSHTWLTPAELRRVLEAPREADWGIEASWWAYLALGEELERRGKEARFVIWFDN